MARKPSATLTDGELRLMRVLWQRGEGGAGDVLSMLKGKGTPAYNTVLTMLQILERKGYLRHRKEGRAFRFYPVIDEPQVKRRAVRHFLSRFFDDSPSQLLLNVLGDDRLDAAELERIQQMLDQRRAERAG